MASPQNAQLSRSQSPNPSSHAATVYDALGNEGEWLDESDDDDMDFEPATDESEDLEFFDSEERSETGFHGMRHAIGPECSLAFDGYFINHFD